MIFDFTQPAPEPESLDKCYQIIRNDPLPKNDPFMRLGWDMSTEIKVSCYINHEILNTKVK